MYYLCSKNTGADQLHGYLAADVCLFRIYAKTYHMQNFDLSCLFLSFDAVNTSVFIPVLLPN